VDQVPEELRRTLTSARDAGRQAREAGARRLSLTHLLPGTDAAAAHAAAAAGYPGEIAVATPGLVFDLS
jgi:ribonuclease BN (tRNA processing enzyme)